MSAGSDLLVIGGSGFLGSMLVSRLSARPADRSTIDLSGSVRPELIQELKSSGIKTAVICAAIADIETCFREPARSHQVNVTGTIDLLSALKRAGVFPIFFSSDYALAPQKRALREDDERNPQTLYGKQKLEVELYIEKTFEKYLIFRTSKLVSKTQHPRNIFYPLIQNLRQEKPSACFEDQWINMCFIEDIADVVDQACKRELSGTYHLGTRRVFTRFELGKYLARSLGLDASLIRPIRIIDAGLSEPRPSHNILDAAKIENVLRFRFTELEDAIPALKSI